MSRLSNEEFNLALGRRLQGVRTAAGLTQTEFADRIGVGQRAYANYERGERETPTAVVRAATETFQVDPMWLLNGPSETPVPLRSKYLDSELLLEILRLIEQWLVQNHRVMVPEKKALAIKLAYEHCMESGIVNTTHVKAMLALAA